MIYVVIAVCILVSGFLIRAAAVSLSVSHCKGLATGPLIFVNGILLVTLAYLIKSNYINTSKNQAKLAYIAYTMILSAGIGNILDELLNKCVLDYVFLAGVYFNVFDVFICAGLFILGFTYLTKKVK